MFVLFVRDSRKCCNSRSELDVTSVQCIGMKGEARGRERGRDVDDTNEPQDA